MWININILSHPIRLTPWMFTLYIAGGTHVDLVYQYLYRLDVLNPGKQYESDLCNG